MFDKNKNIKVGRDININVENSNNLEVLDSSELRQLEKNADSILTQEFNSKFKSFLKKCLLGLILGILCYLIIPYLLSNPFGLKDSIWGIIFEKFQNKETISILSGFASFLTIVDPLIKLRENNDVEQKQYDLKKTIRTILKEREYLNRKVK